MIGILVFANWGRPPDTEGLWSSIYQVRWIMTSALAVGLGISLVAWYGLPLGRFLAVALPTLGAALLVPHDPTVPFVFGTVGLSVAVSTGGGELEEWFSASWGWKKPAAGWGRRRAPSG